MNSLCPAFIKTHVIPSEEDRKFSEMRPLIQSLTVETSIGENQGEGKKLFVINTTTILLHYSEGTGLVRAWNERLGI